MRRGDAGVGYYAELGGVNHERAPEAAIQAAGGCRNDVRKRPSSSCLEVAEPWKGAAAQLPYSGVAGAFGEIVGIYGVAGFLTIHVIVFIACIFYARW